MGINNPPKIYINKVNEDWIIDRVRGEWIEHQNSVSKFAFNADGVWLIAPWNVSNKKIKRFGSKKLIYSIYHIDETKFDSKEEKKFRDLDKYVDAYHVISLNTKRQIEHLTKKKIYSIPFWINDKIWFPMENKSKLREKYNIDQSDYVIGSFQRDTEGADLKSPKLSKGPDRFVKLMHEVKQKHKNLHVLLAGKRRQYIISKLKENNIKYTYYEMPAIENLNELYNCLDLYIVTSRYEGGPQSIFECALTKTPILSTNVGVAPEVLSKDSIFEMENFSSATYDIEFALKSVQKYIIPNGFNDFNNMFKEVFGKADEK